MSNVTNHHPLRQRLLGEKILSPDQWRVAEVESKKQQRPMVEMLVTLGFLSEAVLSDLLSDGTNLPLLDLSKTLLSPDSFSHFPKTLAETHQIFPLFQDNEALHLAIINPGDLLARDAVRQHFSQCSVFHYYRVTQAHFLEALSRIYDYDLSLEGIFRDMDAMNSHSDDDEYSNPTVRLVTVMLLEALRHRASDIHLEPERYFIRVRYRIDGHLSQAITFHERHWRAFCIRLKLMAFLDIAETRFPQNGRFSRFVGGRELDFRLSFHPTYYGENVVIRLLDKTNGVKSLESLGFEETQISLLKRVVQYPQGLVVFTGPTGSGKTTTLYALLAHMGALTRNVMTLEQPIEYQLPLIRQTEILEKGRLTFAEGIRSLLRQDPDILFVGEIRDLETAQMALRASMTGHPIYTTLHAGDSFGVVQRLKDLGLRMEDFLSHLTCVVNQRLVRRYCSETKAYRGRIPVAEILVVDEEVRDLFRKNMPIQEIRQLMNKQGFLSLRNHAKVLVEKGLTTEEEILAVLGVEEGEHAALSIYNP
jgi:type II secretory ATPase GspE/PulE/Tfp pilus assembly ATPase PilB-like protein